MKQKLRSIVAVVAATIPLGASASVAVCGGNTNARNANAISSANKDKNDRRRQPAIYDDNQREKICEWHVRQLEELLATIQSQQEQQQQLYAPGMHNRISSDNNNYGANLYVKPAPNLGFQQHGPVTTTTLSATITKKANKSYCSSSAAFCWAT